MIDMLTTHFLVGPFWSAAVIELPQSIVNDGCISNPEFCCIIGIIACKSQREQFPVAFASYGQSWS